MVIKKHIWRKITEIGLVLFLSTIGIVIHPKVDEIQEIITQIPHMRPVFFISLIILLIGLKGLTSACETGRELKLYFGRALYLPALVGILIAILTFRIQISLLTNIQFILSCLLFILGFILSWTA